MSEKLSEEIYHLSVNNPLVSIGGVETFGKNLRDIFQRVIYLTHLAPKEIFRDIHRDKDRIIVDGWMSTRIGDGSNLIVMQHGLAHDAETKLRRHKTGASMAFYLPGEAEVYRTYEKATYVASCESVAAWIAERFPECKMHGAVIHHHIPSEFFANRKHTFPKKIKVVGHDARGKNKGSHLIQALENKFPSIKFVPLACKYEDRLSRYLDFDAFIHLSVTEGNSYVCLEAMALGIPLFTTREGLFYAIKPENVSAVDTDVAFAGGDGLFASFEKFIEDTALFRRRGDRVVCDWIDNNCQLGVVAAKWKKLMMGVEERCLLADGQ